MSDAGMECRYRGRVLRALASVDSWEFASEEGLLDWRATLVPPGLASSPSLLRRPRDVGSLSLTVNAPLEARPMLNGAHSPDDRHVDEDAERLEKASRRALLDEKAELDRQYHRLFLRALAHPADAPLRLYDDRKGEPYIYVSGYVADLQADRGDPGWVARSCTWQLSATLYEVTNPKAYDEDDPELGRRLILQPPSGYRSDLAAVPPQDLVYPDEKDEDDYDQPWEARAAVVSHS